jgi:subtilisin family serine protease
VSLPDSRPWWYHKDYLQEGVPGISLDKWYSKTKTTNEQSIIVAVIDTQIDLNHEDLQGKFGLTCEIPKNGIDDDHNGYTDDIGWNFTSNGDYVVWANFNILEY